MNAEIERIVAEHRAVTDRRIGDLEAVRRPRPLQVTREARTVESAQQPEDEEVYRPKSWLI